MTRPPLNIHEDTMDTPKRLSPTAADGGSNADVPADTTESRSFPAPLKTWERLGGAEKYTLYTRVSLQVVVVMFIASYGVGILTALRFNYDNSSWTVGVLGTVVVFAVLVVLAVISFERRPELRYRDPKPYRPIFISGAMSTAVVAAVGMVVSLTTSEPWADLGQAVVLIAVLLGTITYVPFMAHKWWVSTGLAVVLGIGAATWFDTGPGIGALWVLLPFMGTVLTTLSVWSVGLIREAVRATELQRTLTLTEERLRFAQELHDTMGQHLAAMSIKAELALALARRGDDRLEGELEALQKLTRTSMSDMREVVEGYRRINLATEIDGACALLATANIPVTVTGDAFDVAEPDRELAAWFVREAVTNVLKHSSARYVQLSLSESSVTMLNDGAQNHGSLHLAGLDALRRRAESRGAGLTVERDDDQFTVTLSLNPSHAQGETE